MEVDGIVEDGRIVLGMILSFLPETLERESVMNLLYAMLSIVLLASAFAADGIAQQKPTTPAWKALPVVEHEGTKAHTGSFIVKDL